MMEHTKEPWKIGKYGEVYSASPRDRVLLSGFALNSGRHSEIAGANDRRIVACVNACEGIPIEQLEFDRPTFVRMLLQRQDLQLQRDELLALIQECADSEFELSMHGKSRMTEKCLAIIAKCKEE